MPRALILFSGGLKSASLIFKAKEMDVEEPMAIHFEWENRAHDSEREAARRLSKKASIELMEVRLPSFGDIATHIGKEWPAQDSDIESTEITHHVPGLIPTMLIQAAVLAAGKDCDRIGLGIRLGDGSWPGISPLSLQMIENVFRHAIGTGITIWAPWLTVKADEPLRLIRASWMDEETLAGSHSCLIQKRPPCGVCRACKNRAIMFKAAGRVDPVFGVKDWKDSPNRHKPAAPK